MIKNLVAVFFMGLSFGFGLLGCGSTTGVLQSEKTKGDRVRVAHSEGIEPLWLQECPVKTEHLLPFCGLGQRKSSQSQACSEAYADALGKLRRTIGQKVKADLQQDGQGGYRFAIQGADSEPLTLRGVWEDQRWSEEYAGPEGRTHDCYVMLTYPKLEYDNLIGLAQKADLDRVAKALELHSEGRQSATSGNHLLAVTAFERALGLLGELKEPVTTTEGKDSRLLEEQIRADLAVSQQEARQIEKTALVIIRLMLDGTSQKRGSAYQALQGKLKNWLSKRGFKTHPGGLSSNQLESVLAGNRTAASQTAAEKGAGLLLVVDVESDFEGKEDNVFYAMARGSLRLIRTSDGRELAATDLGPAKKGHPFSKQNALAGAVDNLCKEQLERVLQEALNQVP